MKRNNPWKTLSSKEIYSNPWITLEEDEIINPAGKPGIYGKVSFKSQAVGIIPVDKEGNTWLVGQYRYGFRPKGADKFSGRKDRR